MSFWCLHKRTKTSKVEFVCSFFGRNVGLKKSFRICLTFTNWVEDKLEGPLSEVWGIETIISGLYIKSKKAKSSNHGYINLSNLFTFLVLNSQHVFLLETFFQCNFLWKHRPKLLMPIFLRCIFSEKCFFLSFMVLLHRKNFSRKAIIYNPKKYYSFNPPYFRKWALKFVFNSIWSLNLLCNRIEICSTNLV